VALAAAPDRDRALENYGRLAAGYDATCGNIIAVREAALAALAVQEGETVFDVACGTGWTLERLARAVGPSGTALGIELCPSMADIARGRLAASGLAATFAVGSVDTLDTSHRADAMLFCYTHDVLQTPGAVERLIRHAKPGCRIAVAGIRFLPWSWGFAINAVTAWRTRHYITTYRGLSRPWAGLAAACSEFRIVRHFHLGSSYLATGRLRG